MAAALSAIANLKGGVGKSTTTVMLADGLAYFYGAEVLVIDLDPQANSSQMLLTERGLQSAFLQGKGVHHLIEQVLDDAPTSLADLVLPNAVTLEALRVAEERDDRAGWVSIIPSHPSLRIAEMSLEERRYGNGTGPALLAGQLAERMFEGLKPILPLYDVVLFDCPPYLSPLARAALSMADVFITPTLADAVSSWGTKQFSEWVSEYIAPDMAERNFVLITRFRNTRYAREAEAELRSVYLKNRFFGPTIPESVQILTAMERPDLESYDTLRGKYGNLKGDVKRLAERFVEFQAQRAGVAPAKRVRET